MFFDFKKTLKNFKTFEKFGNVEKQKFPQKLKYVHNFDFDHT
jgi:hypothetical protein